MNKLGPHPWKLSYSYSRAIQGPVLTAWKVSFLASGFPDQEFILFLFQGTNDGAAQDALLHRTTCNSLAAVGRYETEEITKDVMQSHFTANYKY